MSQNEICHLVMEDMELQKNWVITLKPKVSLLKFRIPLFCETYEYLKGELLLQPWAPESTFETRLIVPENTPTPSQNHPPHRISTSREIKPYK